MASRYAVTNSEPSLPEHLTKAIAKRFNSPTHAYASNRKTSLITLPGYLVSSSKTIAYPITNHHLIKDLNGIGITNFLVKISEKSTLQCKWILCVPIQDKGHFLIKHHVLHENEASSALSSAVNPERYPNFCLSVYHCEVHFPCLGWVIVTNNDAAKNILEEASLFYRQIGDNDSSSGECPWGNVFTHFNVPKKPIYTDEIDETVEGSFKYIKKQFGLVTVPREERNERIRKWANEIEGPEVGPPKDEQDLEMLQTHSTKTGVMAFVQSTIPNLEWLERLEKAFGKVQEFGGEAFRDFEMKELAQAEPEKLADPMVTVLWWKGPPAPSDDIKVHRQPFSEVVKVWEGVRATEPVRFVPHSSQIQVEKGITPVIDMVVYRGIYAAKEIERKNAAWSKWFAWWYKERLGITVKIPPSNEPEGDVGLASKQNPGKTKKGTHEADVDAEDMEGWTKVVRKRRGKGPSLTL